MAKAVFYLHCRQCVEEARPPNIEAFTDAEGVVWVWCTIHDKEIFHTPHPVLDPSRMSCGLCASGVPHKHG